MNIDSISLNGYRALQNVHPGRGHRIESGGDEVRKKAGSQVWAEEPPADEPEATDGEETQEAHGVLRLLQEGHFKGVADLRLRINFAEELAGAQLAEPSAPQSNGKAYQKFLEIYQSMQEPVAAETLENPAPVEPPDNPNAVETPEIPDPVDVVA